MTTQEPIEIVIHPDNVPAFIKCAGIIQVYLDKELYVPAVYVEDFFSLMKSKMKYESQVMNVEAEEQANAAFLKISTNPLYQFEWKERELVGLKEKYNYDTQSVFFELILAFKFYEKDCPKPERDKIIAFFFQAFEKKWKSRLTEASLEKFTPYKQAIISAILAEAVGKFQFSKHQQSLKSYFSNSRNAVDKSKQLFPDEEMQKS